MLRGGFLLALIACAACSSSSAATSSSQQSQIPPTAAPPPDENCTPGTDLTGAAWDVTKSKFAFGSPPVVSTDQYGYVHYTGTNGMLVVYPAGAAKGDILPHLPDLTGDLAALSAAETKYLQGFGIPSCQLAFLDVNAGGCSEADGGVCPTASHGGYQTRAVDGITVADSYAYAHLNVNNQSDQEALVWPTIPAAIVTSARAFRDQVKSKAGLAAYQAKLPANAQGQGAVTIHHGDGLGKTLPLWFVVTWDTTPVANPDQGIGDTLSFDVNGMPVDIAALYP